MAQATPQNDRVNRLLQGLNPVFNLLTVNRGPNVLENESSDDDEGFNDAEGVTTTDLSANNGGNDVNLGAATNVNNGDDIITTPGRNMAERAPAIDNESPSQDPPRLRIGNPLDVEEAFEDECDSDG